jgi:signal recognition particle GTPase
MEKECYKCKTIQPIFNFHKNKKTKDGLESKCKSCISERDKKYYKENTDIRKQTVKRWEENNIERKKINRKSYYDKNRETEIEYAKKRFQELYNNDIEFKIVHNIRNRINRSIKKKSNSTKNILGCNIKEYLIFLEKQFDENMSWDNYGIYWEIDHIIPINTFSIQEKIKAFHYKNTRPLSITENRNRPRDGRDLFGNLK